MFPKDSRTGLTCEASLLAERFPWFERHRVQLAAYREHPERFVNGPPRLQRLTEAVWINPPEKTTHQDAVGTTQTDSDDLRVIPIFNTYVPLTRPGALNPLDESERVAH